MRNETETLKLPIARIASELIEAFGATLVAYMADTRSRQSPHRWAAGTSLPRLTARQRLILAHQTFRALEASDGADVARQWFIGCNPRLGYDSPAKRIREFDAAAVSASASAFIDDVGGA